MITGSGVLCVFSCHVRYIEDCQWTGINKAFIGVKGFSLAYLRVIHFETSRLNIKSFARVFLLFFRSFPVHLVNYPECISG